MTEPVHYEVFIEWSGRKALSPLSVKALRARQSRMRERASNWLDVTPDGCMSIDDVAGFFLVLALAALIIIFAPVLGVLLFAVVEVSIVLAIAAGALVARTLLGRPWRVVAINPRGQLWSWKQVGWNEARELVGRIERELAAGAHPDQIAPGSATPEGMDELELDAPTRLVDSLGVRIAAIIGSIALAVWAAIVVVQRLG